MIRGLDAYQQQVSQLQLQQSQQNLRQNDSARDRSTETVVARNRTEAPTRSNEAEQTREDRRQTAINDQPTQAAGKDAAQRRGSILDITA